jgi:hypothetical protein
MRGAGSLAGWLVLASAARAQVDEVEAIEKGRLEFPPQVQKALQSQKPPKPGVVLDRELPFGLRFCVFETSGLRVLSSDADEEEARAVATTMAAARVLFLELTGVKAYFPPSCAAYLLSSSEAKTAFLQKHPAISPENGTRLGKLEGSGIPGTGDWAWWEGDKEKRLDGMVRFTFDWLCRTQGVMLEREAWLHEGLGLFLTHAVTGTHLTWFVQPVLMTHSSNATNVALRSQMDEPGADWLALARELFAPEQKFELEELLHLTTAELEPVDYLRAHALAAYVVEMRRAALGALVTRVGGKEDPRFVLEETLGMSLGELRGRLDHWLRRRDELVAKAAGRRPEEELRAQWQGLSSAQRRVAMAAFERLALALDTTQVRNLQAILKDVQGEPPAAEDAPFFDPKVHAPGQPIARRRLGANDGRVKRAREEFGSVVPADSRGFRFDYDWARSRVVRLKPNDDPDAQFEAALRGVLPGSDLARAHLIGRLAREDERKLQQAFAHAYTDRDGNVYPLTLFEAWCSGKTIEMPDVDTLGILHDVLNERRWSAPVPASQHDAMYEQLGDLFRVCRRSRELVLALADAYLAPNAPPRAGYDTLALNLQALWAAVDSDPQKLAAQMPDGKGGEAFLADLVTRCRRDYKYYGQGRRRAAQWRLDGQALRVVLGNALDEGAAAPSEPPSEPGPVNR